MTRVSSSSKNNSTPKNRTILLTLSSHSIPGGVEVYASALKNIVPELEVWGRENSGSHDHAFSLPFVREPMIGWHQAQKLRALENKPRMVFTSGLHGWALDSHAEKIPTISILHGTFAGLAEKGFPSSSLQHWRMRHLYSFFEKKSAQNANICVSNSPFTQKEVALRYGVKSQVITPPIDSHIFSPGPKKEARKKLGWNSDATCVLFVGNQTYSKGWDIILTLASQHPNYQFHCVCVPPVPSGVKNVIVHSPVAHEKLVEYYRAADALVFPSRYEGFGFVPLEALACHCPVVASKVGIFQSFKNSNTFLVHDFSATSFDKSLVQAINHSPISTSNEISSHFSQEEFTKKWRKIIDHLLESK